MWSVRRSFQTISGPPLPNVTRHSGWWPSTVTPSIDQTLHQFFTLLLILILLPNLTFYLIARGFCSNICNGCGMPTEDAYYSGHLVLSHFGTCKLSNVETNLSWTFLVFRTFEFRTSLGTSVFACRHIALSFRLLFSSKRNNVIS